MAIKRESSLYRTCVPVVDARYDEDADQTLTGALITALAEVEGVDPAELPPLYDTVDSEAIEQLFEQYDETSESTMTLSFTAETWNVFINADGRIRVCDMTQVTEPEPVFEKPSA